MKKGWMGYGLVLMGLVAVGSPAASGVEEDPLACLKQIERVCVHLDDHLETCLAERGDQLSESCRGVLKMAMTSMQDSTGPAACLPDVQSLCPGMRTEALGKCITEKQTRFSAACQKYLHAAGQSQTGPLP